MQIRIKVANNHPFQLPYFGVLAKGNDYGAVSSRDSHDARYGALILRLRTARKSAGITQADLAASLGTRQQFVSKYESGERRLDMIELLDIADALNIDRAVLLSGI